MCHQHRGFKVPSNQTTLGLWSHQRCLQGREVLCTILLILSIKRTQEQQIFSKTPQPWVGRAALSGDTIQTIRIRMHNSLKCFRGEKSASGRICEPRCEVRVNSQSRQKKRGINNRAEEKTSAHKVWKIFRNIWGISVWFLLCSEIL